MTDKLKSFIDNFPKLFKAGINPNITAILTALANSDQDIVNQIQNTNDQLFVSTATGTYLDRLASNYGIARPLALGLTDSDFQSVISILALRPKQIRKTMIELMDVIWGPTYTRANVQTLNAAPFNVSAGDTLTVVVDNNPAVSYTAQTKDIAINGAATAQEIVNIFSNFRNTTAFVYTDITTGDEYVNVRTNTAGAGGSIQMVDGGMVASNKLNFSTEVTKIYDLSQYAAIFEIRNGELVFEIPALVPLLKRTLLGSHHFHVDYHIAPPEPPSNDIWQGSFFYSRSTTPGGFTISGQAAVLQQTILPNQTYTYLQVTGANNLPNSTGYLIFDFGTANQEQPVEYFGIPNSNLIFINPQYTFQFQHNAGANINFLSQLNTYVPRTNGQDLAIYLTSPVGARDSAESLINQLVAAGITSTFDVILPNYYYPIIPNPYLD